MVAKERENGENKEDKDEKKPNKGWRGRKKPSYRAVSRYFGWECGE